MIGKRLPEKKSLPIFIDKDASLVVVAGPMFSEKKNLQAYPIDIINSFTSVFHKS